ncbi:hypothetical protein POV27_14385 [Aureisphaera galaxeae]|uniref:DUF6503 family protein n=1 Tax=Aureisphaera galaxeae TaxID=1538023 RepID=UPI002350DE85|nr:DUF6503 family protein [Aureisphaera galaxeae]MDC8005246.1 hypothetical protein [Aureisphaera galaxeae]
MKNYLKPLLLFAVVSVLFSCKSVDLRSDYLKEKTTEEGMAQKGIRLLTEANQAMGYDKLASTEVYEATAHFKWKGALLLMPMNALPGNNNKDVQFRFATNSFDGQVEYLEGRKENKIHGLQSWQGYYAENAEEEIEECNSKRYSWGLSTYHYLLEAPMRLLQAEIIKYAGERTLNGKTYDLVFVTWGSEAPNKEYDQWMVYINKETKFIDMTEVTISDFFVPSPKPLQHGSILYEGRTRTSIGTYLPSEVVIQIGKPKEADRGAYRISFKDYKFDSFNKDLLYPLQDLEYVGDSKPDVGE